MKRSIRNVNRDLYHEAGDGNLDNVKELIAQGANVNSQDGEFMSSPLHIACKNGHNEVVKCILKHNADVNLKDENGHTPLHVAVNYKKVVADRNREQRAKEIVELLINSKADIHAIDRNGLTPLHACVDKPMVTDALLKAGASCNIKDDLLRNPLHYAADGHVAEILCAAKTDVNLQDINGRTPLHEAAWYNHHEVVRVLLPAGANIYIKDKMENTPQKFAIARDSKEIIEMFRQWKDNQRLSDDKTPEKELIPQEIMRMDQRSLEIYKEALKEGKECDYTIRLMVVGPQGVGKTTLVNRLLKLGLDHKKIESTNGIDVHVHRSVVTLHNGEWILNEDDVRKLTNHDYRLGKVVKSIVVQGNEQNDSDNVTNIDLDIEKGKIERKREVHSEIATKAALLSRQHDDDAEVLAEETVSKSTSDTSVYQKHSMDAEIKEDLSKVIDAMKSESSQNTYGQISVWDFGGDFIFYTTHQTFLSPRGIYLVVVDITKMLFDEYQDRDCYVDISGLQYLKMGEYIVFWLNSIHTYAGNNEGMPPVILVATHLDKLKGDQESGMEQFFDNVRNCLMENGMSLYNHLDDDNFGVDNTNLADDSVLGKLREKIFEVAKKQKYWGEEKPASWIKFEKILLEKQNIGIKILSFEEVVKLSKGVNSGSMNHEELDLFLKFQHAIGNLIYFSDLKEYIVLEPKWLINAFRCLITHEKFQRKMSSAIRTKWNVFSKTAELKRELIDVLWDHINENQRKHLLGLMEKLDIIARPMLCEENKDRNTENEIDMYFVPAVLKEIITTDQLSRIEKYASITPNMYFDFQNRFLSPSVFHRLIAACLKKWDIAYQENMRLLFCGCGIFDVDKSRTTRIMISIEKYRIKARILYYQNRFALPGYCKQSVEIKQFVEETLENVFGRYQQKVPYKLLIECRPSGGELIPVDHLMQFPSINCTKHDTCHIVISRQLLEHWFSSEEYEHLEDNGEAINLNYWLNDHRPSDKQLGSIAETIGSDFFSLAFKLDLNYTEIIEIEKKYPGQLLRQCAEMLFKWRDKGDRKTKTLGNLYEAMCLVGCDIQGLLKVCSR